MSSETYVVGVDFGTLSGRALVVRVSDGDERGAASHEYRHGVLDTTLPDGIRLPPEWALQVPEDYREVLRHAVPAAVAAAGVDPADVIGIATDFTACTMVPTLADGTPLNEVEGYADRPHAYVKLWRHHAAQGQADRINQLAEEQAASWLARYGGPDLLGMGVREGAPAVRGGPRALRRHGLLGRGGRLDRLAALRPLCAQRLLRWLQGHSTGRPLPLAELPRGTRPGFLQLRS